MSKFSVNKYSDGDITIRNVPIVTGVNAAPVGSAITFDCIRKIFS